MSPTHTLSDRFKNDLTSDILAPLLREVQEDDTLLMGIRSGYISIYYRGGQLLKVEGGDGGSGYKVTFDTNHDKAGVLSERLARHGDADVLTRRLTSSEDTERLVDVLSELKRAMDRSPKLKSALEREFQQVAARVNSRARSAASSHYFITDIEHASGDARFDMLGVRWKHDERSNRSRLVPVLFEVKYGIDALAGTAGMVDHLRKTLKQLLSSEFRAGLAENVESQFNQLSDLQLLTFNRGTSTHEFSAVRDHVQIVFLLAEYIPHSSQLDGMVEESSRMMRHVQSDLDAAGIKVDLRFATASLCGYSMYECTMLTTHQVQTLLKAWAEN